MRRSAWIAAILAAGLAACAGPSQQAGQKEDLLAAAGFHWRLADSPDWKTSLTGLPAHRFTTRLVDGRTMYFYADPSVCRCIYYGTAQNWATYVHLITELGVVQEQEVYAYLDQAATRGSGGD